MNTERACILAAHMLALPQLRMPCTLLSPPVARGVCWRGRTPALPVSRKHVCVTALAAGMTPEALAELCIPVQQAIAEMQATQLLVLCWCILASQLIVYALEKRDEDT